MATISTDAPVWLSDSALCSLDDLLELSGLSAHELEVLIDSGVLQPAAQRISGSPVFRASCIVQVRTARRLRDDFELDAAGLALALNLLGRIEELEQELAHLAALPPR